MRFRDWSLISLGVCLLCAVVTAAVNSSDGPKSCVLSNNAGSTFSYDANARVGDRTVIFFNGGDCSNPGCSYPNKLISASFSLVDLPGVQWPATVDLVVYDKAASGHQCHGPGIELCRYQVNCQQDQFQYPNFGTFVIPGGCCLNGPFFVGIEYSDASQSTQPALALDAESDGVRCKAWQFDEEKAAWSEWLVYWGHDFQPGFPKFQVTVAHDDSTCAANCFFACDFDGNSIITTSDLVYLVNWFYQGGPDGFQLDLNADCEIDSADYLNDLQYYNSMWFPFPDPQFVTVCTCFNPWKASSAGRPGDANGDNVFNISDAVYLANYIFAGGVAPTPYETASGDANGDCLVNISDVVYLINYVFAGGSAPYNCLYWPLDCGGVH